MSWLPYITHMLHRFEIFSGPGTIVKGLLGGRLAASCLHEAAHWQLCTLMGCFSICAPRKIDLIYFTDWEGCYNNPFL